MFTKIKPVFPNLVIYHEFRDFGHGPRDKILLLVTSHESPKVRDFGKFPRKMGKSHYFAQKIPKFYTWESEVSTWDFRTKLFRKKSVIFPRFCGFLLVIFVIFWVFFCSWFSWHFCLQVGIFKKNHLGTLVQLNFASWRDCIKST